MAIIFENIAISITTTGGSTVHTTTWDMISFVALGLVLVSFRGPSLRRLLKLGKQFGRMHFNKPMQWSALVVVAIAGSMMDFDWLKQSVQIQAELVGH